LSLSVVGFCSSSYTVQFALIAYRERNAYITFTHYSIIVSHTPTALLLHSRLSYMYYSSCYISCQKMMFTMDPLLKHYFDVLAVKPTIDRNLIREAF